MRFLSGEEVKSFFENIVYEKTQVHRHCFDITVKEIYHITGGGELDFGGSEYKPAAVSIVEVKKRTPDDKYGWWQLLPGSYLFKYNELLKLEDNQKAIIQMHPHLIESGAFHPTLIIDEGGEISVNISVVEKISIKENARISEVRMMKT